ncbi:acyltransferase [Endozoicomonas sp. OPT23]|uniref:acyltransferase n=1 Tax=Endozoicomonas sp. OPT23 TaxID=2072845 RepID=UPI00129A686A|nr:acyltransferase [Endozoicomonas sp. OPT23]MRI35467.1 acyltransferase [Endozoicomonas sp. OPT23]
MLRTTLESMRGVLAALILALNTVVISIPLLSFAILKLLIPIPVFRRLMGRMAVRSAELWISINSLWMKLLLNLELDVSGLDNLKRDGYYLVTANHQSWTDILLMQHLLNRRIPFMKFFLKQQLIYVPVIGLCWWALDFPFMKRYSREYLKKHPEKQGKDLESTLKACEKFKTMPVSIVNYLEGTRFTVSKHQKQESPYQHLLKPKAGGISYVLNALGEQIRTLLNITIYYHDKRIGFWDLLCGRIRRVTVRIEQSEIPADFSGRDYQQDERFRKDFQVWVNNIWEEKDERLKKFSAD